MAWAPDYVTLDELKHYERIPADDTADDAELQIAIAAASRAIDRAANRQFGAVAAPVPRFYTAWWDRAESRWTVTVDDIAAAGVVVDADLDGTGAYGTAVSPVVLAPRNAEADGRPWTEIVVPAAATAQPNGRPDGVRVTATFGWSAVPVSVKQACLLQASRFFARRNAPFGVAGSPETGSEMRLLDRVDPDVEVSLRPVRRVWGAV